MTAKRLAWALSLLVVGMTVAATAFATTNGNRINVRADALIWAIIAVFTTTGHVIATRQPRNTIGWLFFGVGVSAALAALAGAYARRWVATGEGSDTFGLAAAWYGERSWMPFILIPATFLLLLFPDGRLLSPRWRPVAWTAGAGILAVFVADGLNPGPIPDYPELDNPMGTDSDWLVVFESGALLMLLVALIGSALSIIVRFRRAQGELRQQMKWIVFAGAIAAIAVIVILPLYGVISELAANSVIMLSILSVPAATAVAILQYRLYDIDVVINKTVVFTVLAGFITAVYAGIVVGLGRLLAVGDANLGLSIAATALVAVAFEPVRARVQHLANRLVYGRRATPYETLAAMAGKLGESDDPNAALQDAARLLADGTGAAQSVVWVADAGTLVPRGVAGSVSEPPGSMDELDGALVVDVRHEGELVGALSLAKRPGEGVSAADRRLVEEFAGQAALLLANTRLRSRLSDRVEELRTSRQRMLAAHDAARHTLERDLHDGAQQELVALKVGLGIVDMIAENEGATLVTERLPEVIALADGAVGTLRDVARGIYPPLLASDGLAAAVKALARNGTLAVTVTDDTEGRYPREVESTAFFSVREALANVAQHAGVGEATVRLASSDSGLVVDVTDGGAGFDTEIVPPGDGLTHLHDRADAQGGTLTLISRPGAGTTVSLFLPVLTSASVVG